MQKSLITLVIGVVVIVNNIPSGDAIQCFVCNSGELYDKDHQCATMSSQPDIIKEKFTFNCSTLPRRDNKYEYVRCRTLVQDVEGEERVVRSCATMPDTHGKTNRCIDRTGTAKIKLRYCECDTDLCNSASVIGWSSLLATTVLFLSTILIGSCF